VFPSEIHYFIVVVGISNKYFPRPEILSLCFLMLRIFVACILSSSQIALNGLQNNE